MATRTKKRAAKKPQAAASIVWFEVPADDLDRAKKFYGSLFGWTFAKIPAAISTTTGTSIPAEKMRRPTAG
jgi:predicted enzyme related to lactoylglutathione lyase